MNPGGAFDASRDPLQDAIWGALTSSHRHLAQVHGAARRYPKNIAPFAAVERVSTAAMVDLRELLQPGESVYLLGPAPPETPGLDRGTTIACLQMILPTGAPFPLSNEKIKVEILNESHAAEMLALITLAYPGFFREETWRMGRYFGVRGAEGQLIAMGGERLVLDPYREVSGVCTHPAHTGQGLGTAVLRRILTEQRTAGHISWLHVAQSNASAIRLYHQLGFVDLRSIDLHGVTRNDTAEDRA